VTDPDDSLQADATAMRLVRRRWASGVAVITTNDDEGMSGATVSAFLVLSLEPPLILVCLYDGARITDAVRRSRRFGVSMLDVAQEPLADRFSGRGPGLDGYFTGVPYELSARGTPALGGALGFIDCAVRDVHEGGDHVLIVATVIDVLLAPDTDDPLLAYEGQFRRLASS